MREKDEYSQDDGKGGLSLRGVALLTVLAVLTVSAVLKNTLPSFRWSYKTQDKEATVTVLTVLAVLAVSVVTATPLKLNPPFPSSCRERGGEIERDLVGSGRASCRRPSCAR